jgi:hypothetical protein
MLGQKDHVKSIHCRLENYVNCACWRSQATSWLCFLNLFQCSPTFRYVQEIIPMICNGRPWLHLQTRNDQHLKFNSIILSQRVQIHTYIYIYIYIEGFFLLISAHFVMHISANPWKQQLCTLTSMYLVMHFSMPNT